MTEIRTLTRNEIHNLREKFMVHVGGFGSVEESDLKPLFNSYLSLLITIESQNKRIEGLKSFGTEWHDTAIKRLEEIESQKEEIEALHDALEMLPPKDVEIHERTKFMIDKTVDRLLIESLQKENKKSAEALDDYAAIILSHEYEISETKKENQRLINFIGEIGCGHFDRDGKAGWKAREFLLYMQEGDK